MDHRCGHAEATQWFFEEPLINSHMVATVAWRDEMQGATRGQGLSSLTSSATRLMEKSISSSLSIFRAINTQQTEMTVSTMLNRVRVGNTAYRTFFGTDHRSCQRLYHLLRALRVVDPLCIKAVWAGFHPLVAFM